MLVTPVESGFSIIAAFRRRHQMRAKCRTVSVQKHSLSNSGCEMERTQLGLIFKSDRVAEGAQSGLNEEQDSGHELKVVKTKRYVQYVSPLSTKFVNIP